MKVFKIIRRNPDGSFPDNSQVWFTDDTQELADFMENTEVDEQFIIYVEDMDEETFENLPELEDF